MEIWIEINFTKWKNNSMMANIFNVEFWGYRTAQATRVPSSANAPTFKLNLAIFCMNGREFSMQLCHTAVTFSKSWNFVKGRNSIPLGGLSNFYYYFFFLQNMVIFVLLFFKYLIFQDVFLTTLHVCLHHIKFQCVFFWQVMKQ